MKIGIKNKYVFCYVTIILSIVMTISLFTRKTIMCFAKEDENILVHYDMSHKDDELIDVSGNGHNAKMVNIEESDFKSKDNEISLNFDGTEKYVEIPKEIIKSESFTIESSYKTNIKADHWLWTLGIKEENWPNVKNYLFVNPLSIQNGYSGKILGGIKDENTELRCDSNLTPIVNEINIITAVFNNGNITFYLNGKATSTINSGYSIESILKDSEEEDFVGYIGKSLYKSDQYYKGSLYDFKVYDSALTSSDISKKYEDNYENDYEKYLNLASENLNVNNINDVRGNITLPGYGDYNTKITWKSSNPSVITDEKEGDFEAGLVNRQDEDMKVKLTATISLNGHSIEKEFNAHVKSKPKDVTTSDYLFAYFAGQSNANGEEIYFASSKNGLNWTELNNSKPVLTSSLGEKGVRDPFIIRSPEGDKFYLIATDLSIYRNNDWGKAQRSGSQYIMVWESTDLVKWSDERMVKVAKNDAGCTWAPEAYYDKSTGEYIVFWASKVGEDNYSKQRIYYSKTRDFYTFTEPKVWLEEDYSVIDCTVIKDEQSGYYYRFTKNESKTYIYLERSKSLMGTFEKVKEWENINSAEGPTCYKLNNSDDWILLVDYFGGSGYYPYKVDFNSLSYSKLDDNTYNLPSNPRHGTVIPITEEEYKRVTNKYK